MGIRTTIKVDILKWILLAFIKYILTLQRIGHAKESQMRADGVLLSVSYISAAAHKINICLGSISTRQLV